MELPPPGALEAISHPVLPAQPRTAYRLWHFDGAVPHLGGPCRVTPRRLRRPRPPCLLPSCRRGCSRSTSRARARSSAYSRGSPSGSPPPRSGPLPRVGPPPRPAPRPPTQRPVARPARIVSPPLPPKPATPSPNGPEAPVVASADAVLVPEVIYVEDDAALAELLEYGLRAHGYRFLAYRNGRDALRELLALDVRGTHPLLLLDVDLPALDGYSIFAALERDRPGAYRVVFTTVHGTEEEQLRGLEAGALDYLVKPISLRVAPGETKRWVGR